MRTLLINVIVFTCLLVIINFICGRIITSSSKSKTNKSEIHLLPNFKDKQKAKQVFKEFSSLRGKFISYVGWTRLPYKGKYTTINEGGDRVHQHHVQDTLTTKTIAVFGGSTVWGMGSANNATISGYLDSLNTSYKVFNFGESGQSARQNLARLVNLYMEGKRFDYIVFYNGVNEIGSCRKNYSPTSHTREEFINDLIVNKRGKGHPIKVAFNYLFLDNIQQLITTSKQEVIQPDYSQSFDCDKNPKRAREIANSLVEVWHMARQLTEQYDGQFMAILQPNAFIGKPNLSHMNMKDWRKFYQKEQFEVVYKELEQSLTLDENSWVYNFTNAFDKDEYIYFDHCHVSENGNLIIANKINQILLQE
jgi:hypothetical protein